jgi:hypothetical protein
VKEMLGDVEDAMSSGTPGTTGRLDAAVLACEDAAAATICPQGGVGREVSGEG